MKSISQTFGPKIGYEFIQQATELQRTRNGVMLARSELATDPLHPKKRNKSYRTDSTYNRASTGARRSARYDRTALVLNGNRY